jgi:hypothetical protein
MKKLLQLSFLLFTSSSLFSQSINSQNFNSLALGNIGTDITGASPGLVVFIPKQRMELLQQQEQMLVF